MMKKSLIFSLAGHLTLFGLFGISLGPKIPQADFSTISFWGGLLKNYDFKQEPALHKAGIERLFPDGLKGLKIQSKKQANGPEPYMFSCVKPQARLSQEGKIDFRNPAAEKPVFVRKESVVMLHPELPYYFGLYFKDRQTVHIELVYNIIPHDKSNSVLVRRKISSGNLEVDLLSMRYLSQYLFLQQSALAPNIERRVKIDFSPK
ncbi:MAG: hypothetical protein PHT31_06205 [Candidatus Omnitrophica bacterium]|nr:hypothetical protein [Candidatus Omnitrophota bacterium]MDD5653731.1 hypothetical protein [Candidatus Omnitrophota bacterium]